MAHININAKNFGVAAGRLSLPADGVADLLDFPQLNAMEIPLELFLNSENYPVLRKLGAKDFEFLCCGGIMDRELSHSIVFSEQRYQHDFALAAEQVISLLADCAVSCCTLDCGMNHLLGNPDAEEALRRILRHLAPALLKYRMTLLLPFHFPSKTEAGPERMSEFLRSTCNPMVKLRLDVFPADLNPASSLRAQIGLLYFEMRSLLFIYDADAGVRISKAYLKPWLELGELCSFDGPFLIAPLSERRRLVFPEAESYSKIISDLRNE